MAKKATDSSRRNISRARATKRPQPSAPPVQRTTRSQKFLRWVTTSNVVLVVGLIVIVAILAVMFYRLTTAPSPESATPSAAMPRDALPLALGLLAGSGLSLG